MKRPCALRSAASLGAGTLFFFILAGNLAAGEPFRRLEGRAITARLGGKEVTDEVHWSYRLERDGRLTSFALGRASVGAWRVEADELCLDRPVDGRRCFEVWLAGDRVELRRDPAPPEEGFVKGAR